MQTVPDETREKRDASHEYVRLYYEHQYDRMGKLEEQRLTVTNIVITVSTVAFTFGFASIQNLNVLNGVGLPVLIILSNLFAIAYINHSAGFMRVHQKRANRVLEVYAQELFELNASLPWPRPTILGGRTRIQTLIHILIVFTALLPIGIYVASVIA